MWTYKYTVDANYDQLLLFYHWVIASLGSSIGLFLIQEHLFLLPGLPLKAKLPQSAVEDMTLQSLCGGLKTEVEPSPSPPLVQEGRAVCKGGSTVQAQE